MVSKSRYVVLEQDLESGNDCTGVKGLRGTTSPDRISRVEMAGVLALLMVGRIDENSRRGQGEHGN